MASGIMDTLPHKLFIAVLSSFSACPFHLSKHAVIRHALGALGRVLTVNPLKPHSLQSKKAEETAEDFSRSDEKSFQKPDAELK